jgi:hypothetical protein
MTVPTRATFSCLALGVASALSADGCKEPIQVTLGIRSNLPCVTASAGAAGAGAAGATGSGASTRLRDVAIFAGPSEASVRARMAAREAPSALIAQCEQTGAPPNDSLGDITLVRESSNIAFIAVVAGLARSTKEGRSERRATDCAFARSDTFAPSSPDCLIAVRQFVYPAVSSNAQLRVSLAASCLEIASTCKTGETCIDGACQTKQVNPDSPVPIPTVVPTTPPPSVMDAGLDTGVPVADYAPFRCVGGKVQWSMPPTCSDSVLCIRRGFGDIVCSDTVSPAECLTPCCSTNPLGGQTLGNYCCTDSVAVQGRIIPMPVGHPSIPRCSPPGRACFSVAECQNCSAAFDPNLGWGVCAVSG